MAKTAAAPEQKIEANKKREWAGADSVHYYNINTLPAQGVPIALYAPSDEARTIAAIGMPESGLPVHKDSEIAP